MAELMTIARPYAEAAFSLALDEKDLSGWSEQLANLATIANDDAMQAMLNSPNYSQADAISVIEGVMGDNLTDGGKNLLNVMAENKRLAALSSVSEMFESLKAAEEKKVRATVISARKVTAEQKKKLSAALNAKFDAEVEIEYEVEKDLISGIKIKVGDWAVDGSAVSQLNKLGAAIAQ